jgi:RNA recognition motif-containing protein
MYIHVSGLCFGTRREDIKKLFSPFGRVTMAVITPREPGDERKSSGFLEMPDENEGHHAIKELDGSQYMGNIIRVTKRNKRTWINRGAFTGKNYLSVDRFS